MQLMHGLLALQTELLGVDLQQMAANVNKK